MKLSGPSPGVKVLGIESTAHTLGIGVASEESILSNRKDMFEPEEGGIHPREAAEHHYKRAMQLLNQVEQDLGHEVSGVDAIAFSQGPGIGQCLDVGAVIARTLAMKHDLELVGVNHCLSHISIGTRTTGATNPTTLYVSGGNTQVIERRAGRYRVVGETLDAAVGNAVDKLARKMGYPHPGGPEIERLAEQTDEILEVSYPIKGMDMSFSGLVTELERRLGGHSDEVVANTFQEHAYAACVEALERSMSQSGSEEALLTGGVAMNSRLREMVELMCEERGANAYFPPDEYCMDNGAMIAHQGLLEIQAGRTISIEESRVRPDWRPDEVDPSW